MVKTGTDNPYIYPNYADKNQDVLGGYGKANVKKMGVLSKKYDLNGVSDVGAWGVEDC